MPAQFPDFYNSFDFNLPVIPAQAGIQRIYSICHCFCLCVAQAI
jgi:hypothetical protein